MVYTKTHEATLAEYEAFLVEQNVADIVPTEQLLRNARRWSECSDSPYSIAPKHLWPNQVRTLRLLKTLKKDIPLEKVTVRSVYRNGDINACAGGSKRSQHLHFNAIDFDAELNEQQIKSLCEFWRTEGHSWDMGLGFYTKTALHIDTSGHRTWGNSRKTESSLCVKDYKK